MRVYFPSLIYLCLSITQQELGLVLLNAVQTELVFPLWQSHRGALVRPAPLHTVCLFCPPPLTNTCRWSGKLNISVVVCNLWSFSCVCVCAYMYLHSLQVFKSVISVKPQYIWIIASLSYLQYGFQCSLLVWHFMQDTCKTSHSTWIAKVNQSNVFKAE